MNEQDIRQHVEESARAHANWAKAIPNGSDYAIKAACDDVAAARRALAQKIARLDHLLGHPWQIGRDCECDRSPYDFRPGTGLKGMWKRAKAVAWLLSDAWRNPEPKRR